MEAEDNIAHSQFFVGDWNDQPSSLGSYDDLMPMTVSPAQSPSITLLEDPTPPLSSATVWLAVSPHAASSAWLSTRTSMLLLQHIFQPPHSHLQMHPGPKSQTHSGCIRLMVAWKLPGHQLPDVIVPFEGCEASVGQ